MQKYQQVLKKVKYEIEASPFNNIVSFHFAA